MTFAEKLRKLMRLQRYSQADIGRALSPDPDDPIHQTTVSKWVRGENLPPSSVLLKLARMLGVSTDFLLDDAQEEPPDVATEAEMVFVRAARRKGVSPDDVLIWLDGTTPEPPAPSPEYRRPIRVIRQSGPFSPSTPPEPKPSNRGSESGTKG